MQSLYPSWPRSPPHRFCLAVIRLYLWWLLTPTPHTLRPDRAFSQLHLALHIVPSSLQVISPPSAASVPALSGAAQATAAGTWPALPTWLFGFACGGAAATAMTYNHLNHPQPAAATASGLRHSSSLAAFPYSSSSSHNSSTDGSSSLAASVLTGVSYSHSDNQDSSGSSSSGESSSSRSSSSLLGSWFGEDHAWRSVLQQLSPFGARSAHGERQLDNSSS